MLYVISIATSALRVGHAEHDTSTSMAALTVLMGLAYLAEGIACFNGNFELPFLYELRKGLQKFAGYACGKDDNAYVALSCILFCWLAGYGNERSAAFYGL